MYFTWKDIGNMIVMTIPLATKIRPKDLTQFVGQKHLLDHKAPLRLMIESGKLSNFILFGPNGCGKTSIIDIIANKYHLYQFNATSFNIKHLRDIINSQDDLIIHIDECYRLTANQADVLLPHMESGKIIFIGCTSENPFHSLRKSLLSRCCIFQFEPLSVVDLGHLLVKAVNYYKDRKISFDTDAARYLINMSCGDGRKIISLVELCVALCECDRITIDFVREVCPSKYMVTGDDFKYDNLSWLHGAMQASDPDSAIFALAKCLESNMDVKVLARRIVIAASEDCCSTPAAAIAANNAFIAACHIGRPECDIVFAHAVVAIATAKRDKSAAVAIWSALKDVREGTDVAVPKELRDMHYEGAKELGNGAFQDGHNLSAYIGVNKKYYYPEKW